jgi:hypothetical protein
MSAKEKDKGRIAFRRVHGRIIPIRIKDAALVGAGSAVALGGGYAASRLTHKAAHAEQASKTIRKILKDYKGAEQLQFPGFEKKANFNILPMIEKVGKKMAAEKKLLSNKLFQFRHPLRLGAAAGGVALIASAGNTKKEKEKYKKLAFASAPILTFAAYYHPLNKNMKATAHYTIKAAKQYKGAIGSLLTKAVKIIK